ncbi:MAG: glycoside hydrolase family 3 C-terminal domain-containing protein [Halanaerobiales bacterium]|nr:glycoside hydrolase family 3 C-terminal domain-containing protein [Halanaerobiales bacterium]HPZ63476.1 glycoside hydrolase family 3 C-terminal domain-containing protein [Halanaerobiales bacterium]HQD04354.1 glycoside hydrolase family 3 C-terminal domain-containing protein [Halanaerobiales bacterium]
MSKTNEIPAYKNPELTIDERVDDLVSRMTLEEKISQMLYSSSAIGRLDVHEYNWWNECLHGVARAGTATVFPQAIGMAATFSPERLFKVAAAIADEARAKYNAARRHEDRGIYKGLTFWTPNINIFRDPRWGRGQETYGEDPYLTSRLGVSFIKGLQGDDPQYMKAAACAKHFAVHSGPESERHEFDAIASPKDMRETYLPAFRDAVKEAKVEAVMGAYNRTNGEPCCASKTLMQDILRDEWGFEGHYVSDCGAILDFHEHHKITSGPVESAALAVNMGCDLNCGWIYEHLAEAVKQGLVSEETIDVSVKRLFRTRFKLGMFDPEDRVPFNKIPYEVNDSDEHRQLALETARESIVLLKNKDSFLPLNKDEIKTIAVIGPNADRKDVLLGNYFGLPSKYVTVLEGIQQAVNEDTRVFYAEGCALGETPESFWGNPPTTGFAEALTVAEKSDVVIMCLGLSPDFEGEEGAVAESDGGGDKVDLKLPGLQLELLQAISQLGKPIVLVLLNGSPVELNWPHDNVEAIVEAWYPGEEGGTAVADVIFGKYNPAGRLPITFVKSIDQLPPFRDYSMENRTYRYMESAPLYPFGYGLSYTSFEYSNLKVSREELSTEDNDDLLVSVEVENTGKLAGDEVVQLYIKDLEASVRVPHWQLNGVQRIHLQPGEKARVEFTLTKRQFALIDEEGKCLLEPGVFRIYVGGQQPDERSKELTGQEVLSTEIKYTGTSVEMEY